MGCRKAGLACLCRQTVGNLLNPKRIKKEIGIQCKLLTQLLFLKSGVVFVVHVLQLWIVVIAEVDFVFIIRIGVTRHFKCCFFLIIFLEEMKYLLFM